MSAKTLTFGSKSHDQAKGGYLGRSNRITEVRLTPMRLVISRLLNPSLRSCFISGTRLPAVMGRPCGFPFILAWSIPAPTWSRRISLSNSANTASIPASVNGSRHRCAKCPALPQDTCPDRNDRPPPSPPCPAPPRSARPRSVALSRSDARRVRSTAGYSGRHKKW